MQNSNWTFLQTFTPQFQAIASELESKIEAAKLATPPTAESLQELSVLLSKAVKILADATGDIPSYDQKQYELQLKGFEKTIETLRASSAPKSKFAFKRKTPAAPAAVTAAAPSPAVAATKLEPAVSSDPPPSTSVSTSSNLILSSHSHKYLRRSELPTHSQRTDLSIFDLDNCIIDLLPPVPTAEGGNDADADSHIIISALHARNLTNCIILLPIVEGSALLHDMSNCLIVLGCHQFRMHSSKSIDVFVSISSNPIIEHCSGCRFAQYPHTFKAPKESESKQSPLVVQDFSHIRATPSPNFSYMDEEEKSRLEKALVILRSSRSATAELSGILPSK